MRRIARFLDKITDRDRKKGKRRAAAGVFVVIAGILCGVCVLHRKK